VRHPIHYFVDCSIAAQHQHQVGALGDGVAREFGRVARRVRRQQQRLQTREAQRFDGTLEDTCGIPPDLARGGIVDQNRLLVLDDLLSITPP
jgi:hypothetical protein